jgi:hypothetical protein
MLCLICSNSNLQIWDVAAKPARTYFRCESCDYLFMDPEQRLSSEQEAERYHQHRNQASEGYIKFFEPLVGEIQRLRITGANKALDYGCGPGTLLMDLLIQKSWFVSCYDPLFLPDENVLTQTYDLVTCTEVWEHLHDPVQVFARLQTLLSSNSILAVMTSAYPSKEDFALWPYRRDMTHVGFFSESTMRIIAAKYNWQLVFAQSPYWVFRKQL